MTSNNKHQLLDSRYLLMAAILAENSYCERRKVGCLLVKYNSFCTYAYFIHNLGQEKIYAYQKQNYIQNGGLLCILNSVPLFLLEYYKEDFWDRVTDA